MYRLLCTLVLVATSCTAWDPSIYPNNVQLSEGYKLFWSVDSSANIFRLAIQAKTNGWVGFGIGEPTSGSMPGADFVTAEWNETDPSQIVIHDRYSQKLAKPIIDECEDWVLVDYEKADEQVTVELIRSLTTNDPQDRPLVNTVNILWAYGPDNQLSYHGTSLRGVSKLELNPSTTPVLPPDVEYFSFDLFMPEVTIPLQETTYMCYSIPIPRNDSDYHIVRINPVITEATATHVHHFLVHICEHENTSDNAAEKYRTPQQCYSPLGDYNQGCTGLMYGWAPGGGPMDVPIEAGFLMGSSDIAIKWLILEVHYDNKVGESGQVDSSGVSITYTPTLRQYNAGMLMLGDPVVTEYPIPGQQTNYHIEADCPEECSLKWPHDIYVFSDGLHMHAHGKTAWSTLWRDGVRVDGYLNRVEYYDFDFQVFPTIDRLVKRGDRINTHCVYDTTDIPANSSVRFGAASSDEMCIEFLAYYPLLLQVDPTGKENLYSFCGKARGVYQKVGNTSMIELPNPDRKFASICGDLQIPETFLWNSSSLTVENPTTADPGDESIRTFGQLPISCAARPVLPDDDSSGSGVSKDSMIIGLGVGCGLLLLAFFGALLFQCSTKRTGYERVGGDEKTDYNLGQGKE